MDEKKEEVKKKRKGYRTRKISEAGVLESLMKQAEKKVPKPVPVKPSEPVKPIEEKKRRPAYNTAKVKPDKDYATYVKRCEAAGVEPLDEIKWHAYLVKGSFRI